MMSCLNNFNIMRENYNSIRSQHPPLQPRPQLTSLQRKQTLPDSFKLAEDAQGQLQKYELPRESIIQAVSIVQWRCQTSLPILRVAHFHVSPLSPPSPHKQLFRKSSAALQTRPNSPPALASSSQITDFVKNHPSVSHYELRIQAETVQVRLADAGVMPFSQALHLLREMLIGFEALFDIFGAFEPGEELVGVVGGQWRMWMDPDLCSSVKKQCSITQKQFIYRIVLMTESHSLQTVQSRLFFSAAKESTYANDCSFLTMLEKLRSFIDTNKIFLPSKVILHRQGQRHNIQDKTKRVVSPKGFQKQAPFKKRKDSTQSFAIFGQASVNLMKNHSHKGVPMRPFPSYSFMKGESLQRKHPIPSSPNIGQRNISFQEQCEKVGSYEQLINQDSSISSITPSPKKYPRQPPGRLYLDGSQHSRSRPALSTVQSTPLFCLSRPIHKKQENPRLSSKPVSQLNLPPKRANIRKYSEQLVKMRSADTLINKKFQGSTICQQPILQQQQWQLQQMNQKEEFEQAQENKLNADTGNASSSSQGLVASSPNNSSSTKEIGTSEMEEAYRSLKMQDLAPHRRNNHSLIQHHIPDSHSKNMTISYQFRRPDPPSDSESESEPQKDAPAGTAVWVNKISDLFSDTVSIKQLKGSIRFKGQQDEPFEKQHLKDVKLDLLEKFGRSVTLHVQDDDCPRNRHNQYKSMQLIEEEIEEVKSFQEDERRDDQLTLNSVRTRRQTQAERPDKDRQISFKDEFVPAAEQECGFNFQTEMYSIRAHRPL